MLISKKRLKENIFIVLIFSVILEYQLTLVHTFFIDRIVKLIPIAILILFFPNYKENLKNVYIRNISKIYLSLILIMACSTVFNLSLQSVVFLAKYYLLLSLPFLMLYKVNPHYFSDRIIKFILLLGGILSANSIILWILVYFGFELNWFFVSSERISRLTRYSYFWGDMLYADIRLGGISRAVGFFPTPNRYGCFLLFPAIVSLGYFSLKKRLVYLIVSALCITTIFMTLSIAATFSLISAFFLYKYFNNLRKMLKNAKRKSFVIGTIGLVLCFLLLLTIFELYLYQRDIVVDSVASAILRGGGKYGYESLLHAFISQKDLLVFYPDKPFGEGLGTARDGRIYTPQYGFSRWIILLGIPGILFFCFFIFYMFKVHVFPALLHSPYRIESYVALVFVVQTIAEIEEGAWLTSSYLYTTALLVLLKRYDFRSVKKNDSEKRKISYAHR